MIATATVDACEFCGTSLLGEPIPEGSRHLYGKASTHFRREIGVQTDGYDGVLYWVCPDCHHGWPRFTDDRHATGSTLSPLAQMSLAAATAHEQARALLVDADAVEATLNSHVENIRFAVGMAGLSWTGWAVDPRTGASLYLLVEGTTRVEPAQGVRLFEQAQSLVGDYTGLPVVVLGAATPAAQQMAAAVRPAPLP